MLAARDADRLVGLKAADQAAGGSCEVLPALMPYAGPGGGLGWGTRDSDVRFGNGLIG
jgi:hypothetical protein